MVRGRKRILGRLDAFSCAAPASAMWSPDGSMIVFADSGIGGNDDL
jgi:hypothetical protein